MVPLLSAWGGYCSDPICPLWPIFLPTTTYYTGHFGKWHLGDNYPYRPQDRGFQETIHHPDWWGITSAADYFGNDYFDDYYRHGDQIEQYQGYCTDIWFEQVMDWIDRCDNQPFLVYIATNSASRSVVGAGPLPGSLSGSSQSQRGQFLRHDRQHRPKSWSTEPVPAPEWAA
jgi:hypothetical protein